MIIRNFVMSAFSEWFEYACVRFASVLYLLCVIEPENDEMPVSLGLICDG